MAETYAPGFQWYQGVIGKSNPTTSEGTVLSTDGTMSLGSPAVAGGSAAITGAVYSLTHIAAAPYFVGTAFGCGAYVTAEIAFDPAGMTPTTWWASWWAEAAEHVMDCCSVYGMTGEQWPGQISGYGHFIELDMFEFDRDQGATRHLWSLNSRLVRAVGHPACPNWCGGVSGYVGRSAAGPQILTGLDTIESPRCGFPPQLRRTDM